MDGILGGRQAGRRRRRLYQEKDEDDNARRSIRIHTTGCSLYNSGTCCCCCRRCSSVCVWTRKSCLRISQFSPTSTLEFSHPTAPSNAPLQQHTHHNNHDCRLRRRHSPVAVAEQPRKDPSYRAPSTCSSEEDTLAASVWLHMEHPHLSLSPSHTSRIYGMDRCIDTAGYMREWCMGVCVCVSTSMVEPGRNEIQ